MRQSRPWLPYVLLAAALFVLAFYEAGFLSPVEHALTFVIAPLERGLAALVNGFRELFTDVRDVQELQETVETLRRANEALRVENIRLREQYVAENRQLRGMLNFQNENPTYNFVGADIVERGCEIFPCGEVLGEDVNPYLRYLIINTGSRDGVAVGMPVVSSGAALVGRVVQVTPHLAYVQLINDPESEIAALLQGSRITGVVKGQQDGSLIMTEILPEEEVEENEIVITSGLGGLLPKGLILGQVETVSYQETALFQEATLRPALDFRRLEVVLVITDFSRPPVEELQE
ncbi:MAG: rod shape-determining protein MreC [Anaerolineae bacterium]